VDRPTLKSIAFLLVAALALGASLAPARADELLGTEIPAEAGYEAGTHFILPNEYGFHAFESALRGKKGAFISVGTFRTVNESLFGDFDKIIMLDYDPAVTEFNRQMLAIAERSKDREEFTREIVALDPQFRDLTDRRFGHFKGNGSWEKTIFGSDAAFARFQKDVKAGKYFVVNGSLTGDQTMPALAAALKKAGLKVGAVDCSNALDSIASAALHVGTHISDQFKANLSALPWNDVGVILHTAATVAMGVPRTGSDGWVYLAAPHREFIHAAEEGAFSNPKNASLYSKKLLSGQVKACMEGTIGALKNN
jgi:hypothetical protein